MKKLIYLLVLSLCAGSMTGAVSPWAGPALAEEQTDAEAEQRAAEEEAERQAAEEEAARLIADAEARCAQMKREAQVYCEEQRRLADEDGAKRRQAVSEQLIRIRAEIMNSIPDGE